MTIATMRPLLAILVLVLTFQPSKAQIYSSQTTNEVIRVDLRYNDNTFRHHTNQYRQMRTRSSSIVLRRGELFDVNFHFRYSFNKTRDKIRIELSYGNNQQLDKGTLIYIPVEYDARRSQDVSRFFARALTVTRDQLKVAINLPHNMAIGIWHLRVTTKLNDSRLLKTFTIPDSLYVIFNPWNIYEQVFMGREDARQEYVLNEIGKIYIGSSSRPCGRTWNYGQFHEAVLPVVMQMLDKTRLDVTGRANVVKVSRAVSAIVNSHDENGLLVGNWSGNYGNGLAPWQWTGSSAIFEKYLQTGSRPVKFGQCWVFGGVTTTVLRTLGIPARTITNFLSAHDTDLSLTVDKFYGPSGEQIGGINGDSIWNFHVWSDAWMDRYDLPPGYDGWQAIDATPQETSMGMYQLGPASLEAIKQGKVGYGYDVGFVFSEVNADLVHWRLDGGSMYNWRKSSIQANHVGKKILTKMIGTYDDRSRSCGIGDAQDITNQYKFPEGSRDERLAFMEAARSGGLTSILNNH